MIGTVQEIGRLIRTLPNNTRIVHHQYIEPFPGLMPAKKTTVCVLSLSISDSGSFTVSDVKGEGPSRNFCDKSNNENLRTRLFWLNYKTSDSDSSGKYIYGDIWIRFNKKGEAIGGNFKPLFKLVGSTKDIDLAGDHFNKQLKKWLALGDNEEISSAESRIKAFRRSLESETPQILRLLLDKHDPTASETIVYIHFNFSEQKCWYEHSELEEIDKHFAKLFFRETEHGWVPQAALYRTIAAGKSVNDRTLEFNRNNIYKNFAIPKVEQVIDLLYGIRSYLKRPSTSYRGIEVTVLPRGDNLTGEQISRFFETKEQRSILGSYDDEENELRVDAIQNSRSARSSDDMFLDVVDDDVSKDTILEFDFIIRLRDGKVNNDIVEVAGLQRSWLSAIRAELKQVAAKHLQTRDDRINALPQLLGARLRAEYEQHPISVLSAYYNLLANDTSASGDDKLSTADKRSESLFSNHTVSILPSILTGNYYQDSLLLPEFVRHSQAYARLGSNRYHLLRFDFLFLMDIQKGQPMQQIINEPSYILGYALGILAREFAGESTPIKSFEKNYVGHISRRVGTRLDVMALYIDIVEKLTMHEGESRGFNDKTTSEYFVNIPYAEKSRAGQIIKESFPDPYYKDMCAFGFLEGYYEPYKAKAV